MRRLPSLLTDSQARLATDFIASFSALAASVPWSGFTLEVNPLKLGKDTVAAVYDLLIVEASGPTLREMRSYLP